MWAANRVSGILVFVLLLAQVVDLTLVRLSAGWAGAGSRRVGVACCAAVLVAALVVHALTGLGVMRADLWVRRSPRHQPPGSR